jgi:hypothetical protein
LSVGVFARPDETEKSEPGHVDGGLSGGRRICIDQCLCVVEQLDGKGLHSVRRGSFFSVPFFW